ncbi:Hint domain-containing protein [Acidomonas methanolica]|uniref:Outer membrane protein n=1 Tax=Acidomonas methanolica NBRC 104435 TaxID=1231351 RepID=A0A023D509_ACIMT|nr:Hint domain-containing protein [Acidomonas methanolica]TCS28424.1 Hint domain-containing protein [Acidomonas methanolica]GAJ29207.1 outer membrane protein [Acidomonas methanolica NBRC 104435]GBQ52063.1 hypothetical protein AA0498_1647 [Acidomonas methanolica]GEK99563.1 hypothetical protein AME01nite_20620 [Acidomonas methanolica NBRC 104435]
MTTIFWQGGASNDWYDPANWRYGNLPQSDSNQAANVSGTAADPALAVLNAPSYSQIDCLTVGDDATVKITATTAGIGNVFATRGTEVYPGSNLIIDTPAAVELGIVTKVDGTLTIIGNDGKVVLDGTRIVGGGTVNLVDSTLGSATYPVSLATAVTLSGNSTLYAGFYGDGASVTFDPATQNTLYVTGNESTISTPLYGVSENTIFGIEAGSQTPVSAAYTMNSDGTYSLSVTMTDGKALTFDDIHLASGFVPASPTIEQTSSGWAIVDTNASSVPPSYDTSDTHLSLVATATAAQQVGGDTSQYSTTEYSQHNGDQTDGWNGGATGNWSTASDWSTGAVPEEDPAGHASLAGTESTPVSVTLDTPYYQQITSLSIGPYATMTITATADRAGYVFATQGMQIAPTGALVINTASPVELGGVTEVRGGTVTIENNDGKVVLDDNRLTGTGTLNLINSTLGTVAAPVRVGSFAVNLTGGSTLYAGFYASGSSVTFDPTTRNTLYVTGDESTVSTALYDVSANTVIGIEPGAYSAPDSAQYVDNGDGSYSLVVSLADGKTLTFSDVHFASGFTPVTPTVTAVAGGGWIITDSNAPCYLAQTLIRTDRGDVAVEDLRIGDQVVAFDWENGRDSLREIVWVGKARTVARPHLPDDEAGYPVRVLKDAIADGVPYKDMLITSEHCLFFEGKFIPVRMLVNGRSVFYDKTIRSYDYYHVETERHSVIMADGVLSESYLDTGNHRAFRRQEGNVISFLNSRNLTWDDAAAPLGVAQDFAEPLHQRIAARAEAAGLERQEEAPELTTDADLHLMLDNGAIVSKLRENNGRVMFMLPTGVTSVRLVSRASRPADVIGPFVDDRRYFGVAVGEITMFESGHTVAIRSHLTEKGLDGWNDLQWEDTRWTSGSALLPLGQRHPNSIALLAIQVRAAGPYLAAGMIGKTALAATA